jgi:putative membrane-bound dehydrogenase-like protein
MRKLLAFLFVAAFLGLNREAFAGEQPRSHDLALQLELFARAPDIVHPIGMAFDVSGRLLVIESHTHFRPANYTGPKHDRIRLVEDTNGDGRADRFTTYFEGTNATMDIAIHPDGAVYLATRNEILRLRDRNGDGRADEKKRIVFLETSGNYPHNGISGLSFDFRGNLVFGMGENLGAPYRLLGADGTVITDEGEGGNLFECTAEGKNLRRVATGFWNPFGTCRDVFGRLFAVDNDPDAMPPCRLLHVVPGADFGYQFRYGRSGRHPFQCWNGQLPGTLPMMAGTGEAPCEVVSYESDGLPAAYLGNLLVASWADHRIERYVVKEQGATLTAERRPFVQGGGSFRPVGLAVAPDGSLFISDWVRSDYTLHGQGAIWHLRRKEPEKSHRPVDFRQGFFSRHRPLRESAARRLLAEGKTGRDFLRRQTKHEDVRARALALTALLDAGEDLDLGMIAGTDSVPAIRAMAVRGMIARRQDATTFVDRIHPPGVRAEAMASVRDASRLLEALCESDPFLRHAAIQRLAHVPEILDKLDWKTITDSPQRVGIFLAHRTAGRAEDRRLIPEFLGDANADIRFLAVKWVADRKLADFSPRLEEMLKDPRLSYKLVVACTTALARIKGQPVTLDNLAGYFLEHLHDRDVSPETRVMALRVLSATHRHPTLRALLPLLADSNVAVQIEAARTLREHPDEKRMDILSRLAGNNDMADQVRAEAIVGLAAEAPRYIEELLGYVQGDNAVLGREALRALVHVKLSEAQKKKVESARKYGDLVTRVLGQPWTSGRPPARDLDRWLKRLEGPADKAAGHRIFFHPRLAGCYRCHQIDGRGADIGPDLSDVGKNDRRHVLESILQPGNLVPPHYQAWILTTSDGKTRTGMLVRTVLDEYTYADPQGNLFKVNTRDIENSRPATTSIMPDALVDVLTDQEVRDLLTFLMSHK